MTRRDPTPLPAGETAPGGHVRPDPGDRPRSPSPAQRDAVRRACAFIDAFDTGVPSLAEIAAAAGFSPHHLQRVFTRLVGVSPRAYAEGRRVARVKALLRAGDDVSGALYEAGYGSPSRLYESADRTLGMTPATYRRGGEGARIAHAVGDCSLGRVLVAATGRGVCFVAFGDTDAGLVAALRQEFPKAEIATGTGPSADMTAWLAEMIRRADGAPASTEVPLDVRATAFQWRVWQALAEIPPGETRSYAALAASLGKPGAQRAVGRACATNPVAVAVPCHRAVRTDGYLGGYRWGLDRKAALLDRERSASEE